MSSFWRIGKTFRFEATREVRGRLDGRTFAAEVVLSSTELSGPGFVVDYGELAPVKKYIDTALDHQLLNQIVPDTSDAGLARHLMAWARNNLPPEASSVLRHVRILTGRPAPVPEHAVVDFDASHRLEGLPAEHQCARLHGHSYRITFPTRKAAPTRVPPSFAAYVDAELDGRLLNEVFGFNPTCEHLAEHFARWLHERNAAHPDAAHPGGRPVRVRVSETDSTWGEYQQVPE